MHTFVGPIRHTGTGVSYRADASSPLHVPVSETHHYFDASSFFGTLPAVLNARSEVFPSLHGCVCGECLHVSSSSSKLWTLRECITEPMHTDSFEMAAFPKSFYGWFFLQIFSKVQHFGGQNTNLHRETAELWNQIHTGPLPAQEGCSCQRNRLRAGLCSHTNTKTPSSRASHWLPCTAERCFSTEEPVCHEAPVHKHRFKHLSIHTIMRDIL